MSARFLSLMLFFMLTLPAVSFSQKAAGPVEVRRLDSSPYTPGKDPDIDLYMCNWRDSQPRHTYGSLVERDVLTRGDPAHPARKGAVLKFVNRFSHASLYAHASTTPATLSGEQVILYFLSGKGNIKSGQKSADLREGIFVLIPDKCSFQMTNTGDEPLTMYLIAEPIVSSTFKPPKEMLTVDENILPISSSNGHWSMIIKTAFNIGKELSIIEYVNAIVFDPMTIGHPHAHLEGCEEVWTSLEGTSILFLGKQIRMQSPGTAYLCPPYGDCTHSNINHMDKPLKFLYFAVREDWEKNDKIKRTRE